MISLEAVSKRFPGASGFAVKDLSLSVDEGQTVALVGPSGCGKTTTLRMINRLIEPTGGSIFVDGKDVMKEDPVRLRRGIGYVIQSVGLLPHRNVAENIAIVPRLVGWDAGRVTRRVEELAAMFHLDSELLDRYPSELSGGQQQRVGVARALAIDPPVMLMDEPFGAVDPIIRGRLQDQFLDIQRELHKTIVLVTHDVDEAIKMADRVAIMNIGGVVEQYASPAEILRDPANEFVKEFVGSERGLKRLSLIRVSGIGSDEGPVVDPTAPVREAIEVMDKFGYDWTSVVEEKRLLGWVDRTMLEGLSTVGEARPRRFVAHVTPSSSLREALDTIVTSRTNVAVVLGEEWEGQEYIGILTVERISKEIIS